MLRWFVHSTQQHVCVYECVCVESQKVRSVFVCGMDVDCCRHVHQHNCIAATGIRAGVKEKTAPVSDDPVADEHGSRTSSNRIATTVTL